MIFYPSKVDIETVNRFCNARCPMCTIKFVPDFTKLEPDEESHNGISRKAEVMSLKTFEKIADKFSDNLSSFCYLYFCFITEF